MTAVERATQPHSSHETLPATVLNVGLLCEIAEHSERK